MDSEVTLATGVCLPRALVSPLVRSDAFLALFSSRSGNHHLFHSSGLCLLRHSRLDVVTLCRDSIATHDDGGLMCQDIELLIANLPARLSSYLLACSDTGPRTEALTWEMHKHAPVRLQPYSILVSDVDLERHKRLVWGEPCGKKAPMFAVRQIDIGAWALDHLPTGTAIATLATKVIARKAATELAEISSVGIESSDIVTASKAVPSNVKAWLDSQRFEKKNFISWSEYGTGKS